MPIVYGPPCSFCHGRRTLAESVFGPSWFCAACSDLHPIDTAVKHFALFSMTKDTENGAAFFWVVSPACRSGSASMLVLDVGEAPKDPPYPPDLVPRIEDTTCIRCIQMRAGQDLPVDPSLVFPDVSDA
jgi:hypothetical protein